MHLLSLYNYMKRKNWSRYATQTFLQALIHATLFNYHAVTLHTSDLLLQGHTLLMWHLQLLAGCKECCLLPPTLPCFFSGVHLCRLTKIISEILRN